MEFRIGKRALIITEKGKVTNTEGIQHPHGNIMKGIA